MCCRVGGTLRLGRRAADAGALAAHLGHRAPVADHSAPYHRRRLVAGYPDRRTGSALRCRRGRPGVSTAPLAIQYRDFALWQRSWLEAGEQARQLEYWLDHLGNDHPVLQLPSDHLRPALPSYRGERLELQIDAALAQRLQALARRHNVTLFVVLLAAFKTLLYRYSGQSRVRVGVPIANRNRSEVEGLIGCFINTQVLQTDIDPTQGGAHLLSQVKACAAQAQSHQDVPFDQLVEALGLERTGGVSPLFQVLFNHQSMVTDVATVRTASGLELEKLELRKSTARFDLTLDTVEVAGQLRAAFTFALDLFERDTVEAMGRDWLSLLAALSRDDVAALGDWPLAGAPVAAPQVLPYAGPLLHQRVTAFAKAQPQRIAVVSADGSLSYGELDARADQLCAQLQAHGVVADQPVGLIAERSVNLLVGLLAILKAGGRMYRWSRVSRSSEWHSCCVTHRSRSCSGPRTSLARPSGAYSAWR